MPCVSLLDNEGHDKALVFDDLGMRKSWIILSSHRATRTALGSYTLLSNTFQLLNMLQSLVVSVHAVESLVQMYSVLRLQARDP